MHFVTPEKTHTDPSAPLSTAQPTCPLEPRLVLNSVSDSALFLCEGKGKHDCSELVSPGCRMQSVTAQPGREQGICYCSR